MNHLRSIAGWTGSSHDCHDSVACNNVPGSGGKNLLYSADGYATRHRLLDITSVRSGGTPTLVGETAPVAGIYAHSSWLTKDSHYLYTGRQRSNSANDASRKRRRAGSS